MYGQDHHCFTTLINDRESEPSDHQAFILGGLFLDHKTICPPSFVSLISAKKKENDQNPFSNLSKRTLLRLENSRQKGRRRGVFLSVSLSIKGRDEEGEGYGGASRESLGQNEVEKDLVEEEEEEENKVGVRRRSGSSAALNTTKHLWAGAVAAMVSRSSFLLLID